METFVRIRKVFRRWLLRSLQPCENMVPLMSESIDRSLGPGEWLRLRLHLFVCAWCSRYLKQIKFIRQLLREEMPDHRSGASALLLHADARERISKSILEKQRQTTPSNRSIDHSRHESSSVGARPSSAARIGQKPLPPNTREVFV